jgi:hypothetical protein
MVEVVHESNQSDNLLFTGILFSSPKGSTFSEVSASISLCWLTGLLVERSGLELTGVNCQLCVMKKDNSRCLLDYIKPGDDSKCIMGIGCERVV